MKELDNLELASTFHASLGARHRGGECAWLSFMKWSEMAVEPQAQHLTRAEESILEIEAAVRAIIAEHARRPAAEVPLDAKLEGQLEIDSMGMIAINVSLEERFRIAMPDMAVVNGVSTVRDLVSYIHRELAEVRR